MPISMEGVREAPWARGKGLVASTHPQAGDRVITQAEQTSLFDVHVQKEGISGGGEAEPVAAPVQQDAVHALGAHGHGDGVGLPVALFRLDGHITPSMASGGPIPNRGVRA